MRTRPKADSFWQYVVTLYPCKHISTVCCHAVSLHAHTYSVLSRCILARTYVQCVFTLYPCTHIQRVVTIYPCTHIRTVCFHSVSLHTHTVCCHSVSLHTYTVCCHSVYPCTHIQCVVTLYPCTHIQCVVTVWPCTHIQCVVTLYPCTHIQCVVTLYPCTHIQCVVTLYPCTHIQWTTRLAIRSRTHLIILSVRRVKYTELHIYITVHRITFRRSTDVAHGVCAFMVQWNGNSELWIGKLSAGSFWSTLPYYSITYLEELRESMKLTGKTDVQVKNWTQVVKCNRNDIHFGLIRFTKYKKMLIWVWLVKMSGKYNTVWSMWANWALCVNKYHTWRHIREWRYRSILS